MKFTPYDKPNPFPKQGLMGDSQNCFAFWEHPPPHMAFTHSKKQSKHNHEFKATYIKRFLHLFLPIRIFTHINMHNFLLNPNK